ncbi:Nucleotidyltransferase domain-containing protein [Oceanobacillus limi]|uniref:Nucleotidyltransferase domain-containing protein n=1 Tax=Oceanobacillus limi TaxID=930131 RepID=A0A1I0GL13_9BACI|nr:aminoglycoside adenylyltransferase domain-containing protein [Oceanobacillus limi]SET71641.1 Nucleotidyltransferase domain-containing protein [Oceanobacillus limi]
MQIPRIIHTVLRDYINLLNEYLPGTVQGVYVHGSIALDAYVENSSDIDFITITSRPYTKEDFATLESIHLKIAEKYPHPEMDGVYIVREDVGKCYKTKEDFTEKYLFYNDGSLHIGDYFNFNPVTWWTFKHKGINIIGPAPNTFELEVDSSELTSYVRKNMNDYWATRIQEASRTIENLCQLPTEQIDTEIEWIVLGLLRQFYTLKESDIISKSAAGEYGLLHMPNVWHPIIREAIHIRKGEKLRRFDSDQERIKSTISFAEELIRYCNVHFSEIEGV